MITRYDEAGASSRLRHMQYVEPLRAAGIKANVSPFFDHHYLSRLYSGQTTLSQVIAAYGRRVKQLWRTGKVDVLWLEKEALPWLPWGIEGALLPKGVPLVVDYDDAVFHNYDLHHSGLVRRFMGQKLDKLMARASLVTAGNPYLAMRARSAGAARVEIVPTVVDLKSYTPRPAPELGADVRIGWIGTPSTWTEYMEPMMPLLSRAAQEAGARILAVGAGQAAKTHPLLDNLAWSEEAEVSLIHQMDIGIMPLSDTPWARGKCGYKLIQYMACGIPVIASPVGVNADIVEQGVNGFLATTDTEWREALAVLLHDPVLRRRMGAAGRKKVEEHYTLQVWGPRVASLLRDVIES
jgi:glycosyltransferase involved in cell wall biosynthesis